MGESIRCQYTATAQQDLVINGTHTNTIDADWSTQDGTSNTNERNYTDSGSYTWVDGTQDTDTASFGVSGVTFSKTVDLASARIGETLHYTLTLNAPLGTLNTLVITDVLPTGLVYNADLTTTGILTTTGGVAVTNGASTQVVINLGNAQITQNPAKLYFTARVGNSAQTNKAETKTNSATLGYTNVAGSRVTFTSSVNTVLVEPGLTISKVIKTRTNPTDAGDTLVYEITLANPAGSNVSTAYDVVITDAMHSMLDLITSPITITAISGIDTALDVSAGNNLTITVASIAPGGSLKIAYSALVVQAVSPDQTIPNQAVTTWTSLPGVNSGERNGSGGVNDYQTSSSTSFKTASPSIAKSLYATSDSLTAGSGVAIGEVVTYTLLITLPESTVTGLVVTDLLPAGLAYSANSMTLDAAGFGGLVATPVVGGGSGSGSDVTFTFQPITVTANASTADNAFRVRFAAVLLDEPANQASPLTALNNSANLKIGAGTVYTSGVVAITVLEPQITTAKIVTPLSGVQAGSLLTYTVSFTNTGNSPAYDVTAVDGMAQGVTFTALKWCKLYTGPAFKSDLGVAGVKFDGTASASWDIVVGDSVVCQYTATAQPGLYLDGVHTNTIDADWTSQDGGNPNERTYADTDNSSQDLTQDADSADFSVDGITISKSNHAADNITIGEVVTYSLDIVGPKGTLRDLVITDTLPAGLIYQAGSVTAAGITLPNSFTSNAGVLNWQWDPNSAVLSQNTAVITYTVVLTNSIGNQSGMTRQNTVQMTYRDALNVLQPVQTDTTLFDIAEPVLTIQKTIVDRPLPTDAGDSVTYRLVLSNPTGANAHTAHDIVLTDTLPAGLALTGVTFNPAAGVVDNSTPAGLELNVELLTIGSSLTITYTTEVSDSVTADQTIGNTANVTWTSLAGTVQAERTGSGGVNDYHTSASASFTTGSPAIQKSLYGSTASHTAGSQLTIGEVATYTLSVTLPEGTISGLVLTDTLPAGLRYVAGSMSLVTTGFGGVVLDPAVGVGTGSGGDVIFTFTPVTVTANNLTSDNTFVVRFAALVLDEAGNQGAPATTLTNQAQLKAGSGPGYSSGLVDITVVEPTMIITKVMTPTEVLPNSVVTVTLTVQNVGSSTAFDVQVVDPITTSLFANPTLVEKPVGVGFATSPSGLETMVVFSGDTLPVGQSHQYQFTLTLNSDIAPGLRITNTAVVSQTTTLPGVNVNERSEPEVTATDTVDVIGADLAILKTDGGKSATPGRTVVYTLTVQNNGDGTAYGIVISDTVPTHTTFNKAASSSGWSCAEGAAAGSVCTMSIGTMTPADPDVLKQFVVQVDNPLVGVTELVNTAGVYDNGAHGTDRNPANNHATEHTPILTGSVGDRIWIDRNGDGLQTSGELNLTSQVGITLTWSGPNNIFDGTDDVTYITTTTNGNYNFAGLPVGKFNLEFSQPNSYFFTAKGAGSGSDSIVDPLTRKSSEFQLTAGQSITNQDAGLYQMATLGDYVWLDDNGDGLQGGLEPDLASVSVGLYTSGGTLVLTTTTNASGLYTFTVKPGDYYLQFAKPAGYIFTTQTAGTATGSDPGSRQRRDRDNHP